MNAQQLGIEQVSSPPRSRLYRLEPIGVGTSQVESLTSYVARLAEAHHVTPKEFVMYELFLVQGETKAPDYYSSVERFWQNALSLNGSGSMAQKWVEILQTKTSCSNLQYLTMLIWRKIVAQNSLLRPSKAWCPQCYEEWHQSNRTIYEPLLWALRDVNYCLQHQQPLVVVCPHCRKTSPFLKQGSRPGYCSLCANWLGEALPAEADDQLVGAKTEEYKQQLWKAQVVGGLLAAAPTLPIEPTSKQLVDALNFYLEQYTQGNVQAFARLLGMSEHNVGRYLRGDRVPSFDSLLYLCSSLMITPLELLTLQTHQSKKTLYSILEQLPVISRGKGERVTSEDAERMREALELLLELDISPPPRLKQVAKHFGCRPKLIRKHCSDQCERLIARWRRNFSSEEVRLHMQQTLEAALKSEEAVPLVAIVKQLDCSSETLNRYFPDLYRAIATRWRTRWANQKMGQGMEEILRQDDGTISVSELARQLGCSDIMLKRKFPELCDRVIARRRENRRKHREEVIACVRAEVYQATLALHEQGVYPNTSRVAALLSRPSRILWREAQETWRETIEKLGYR